MSKSYLDAMDKEKRGTEGVALEGIEPDSIRHKGRSQLA